MAWRGILGFRGRRMDRRNEEKRLKNQYESALLAAGKPSGYEEEAIAHYRRDPMADVQAQTTAQWNALAPELQGALTRYRGGQVGRTNTGWARSGEDRIMTEGVNTMGNNVLQNTLWAAGKRDANVAAISDIGRGIQERQLGGVRELYGNAVEERNARNAMLTGLISTGAQIAGGALGGPGGAMAGGRIAQAFGPRPSAIPASTFSNPSLYGYGSGETGMTPEQRRKLRGY